MRRALGPAAAPGAIAYLRLLDRRLGALRAFSTGREPTRGAAALVPGARERALARQFLARRQESWHDGDENLVRGFLDRWLGGGDQARAAARGLVEAADALAAIDARPQTLWFFAWALESALDGPLSGAAQAASRRGGRAKGARIAGRRARPGGPHG